MRTERIDTARAVRIDTANGWELRSYDDAGKVVLVERHTVADGFETHQVDVIGAGEVLATASATARAVEA